MWLKHDSKQYLKFGVTHNVSPIGTKLTKNQWPRTYVDTFKNKFICMNLSLNVKIEVIKCILLKGHFWQGNCRSPERNLCKLKNWLPRTSSTSHPATILVYLFNFFDQQCWAKPRKCMLFLGQGFGGCTAEPGLWRIFLIWWGLHVTTLRTESVLDLGRHR